MPFSFADKINTYTYTHTRIKTILNMLSYSIVLSQLKKTLNSAAHPVLVEHHLNLFLEPRSLLVLP